MTERSAERRVRQETRWLAGGPLQLGALHTYTTDTFLFISYTTNVFLFKFPCNIFIGVRIIKEMPGSVASGTLCIYSSCLQINFVRNKLALIHLPPHYLIFFSSVDVFIGKVFSGYKKNSL